MNGQQWARVEQVDAELPNDVHDAVWAARLAARGAALPVVRVGGLLVLAVDDFEQWYGPLPDLAEERQDWH